MHNTQVIGRTPSTGMISYQMTLAPKYDAPSPESASGWRMPRGVTSLAAGFVAGVSGAALAGDSPMILATSATCQYGKAHNAFIASATAYPSSFLTGVAFNSQVEFLKFIRATPNVDAGAVFGILSDVGTFFSDVIQSIDLEFNYDQEVDRSQLFVSVETNLSSKEIIERRKTFDKAVLSDDAKKIASRYVIPIFF